MFMCLEMHTEGKVTHKYALMSLLKVSFVILSMVHGDCFNIF